MIRVTLTTICGTDVHIVKGEYPVKPGLTIGHEPVGVIHELGVGVTGYQVGERVLVGAITPCGQCGLLLERALVPVRRSHRRLEIWQHNQWSASRIPAGAQCASQPS